MLYLFNVKNTGVAGFFLQKKTNCMKQKQSLWLNKSYFCSNNNDADHIYVYMQSILNFLPEYTMFKRGW